MKRTDLDALVADMQSALEDKDFRSIFDRPVIKTTYASADGQEVNETSNPAEEVFKTLVASSETLDNLGLSKSAERVLLAAQALQTEAMEAADEDESDDKEEDESDADDKKKDKDKKKNDPKEGKKFKEFMEEDPFKDGPKKGPSGGSKKEQA